MQHLPKPHHELTTRGTPISTPGTLVASRIAGPCSDCLDFRAVKIRFSDELITVTCKCATTAGLLDDIEGEDGDDHEAEGRAA
ncbi:hypothetical protein [Streptomyces lunalinharesii]|uniref:Uncharacterized protein n=1 Tax=Streptomyces lunalinharesii TaxID=333384 RepID=A0ABP6FCY4_9ACTN